MILHYFGATKSLWSQIFAHYASAHESRGNSASGQLVCCGCNINICWCWIHPTPARDLLPHSVSSTVYCLRVSTGQISAAGLWVEQTSVGGSAATLGQSGHQPLHCGNVEADAQTEEELDPQYCPTLSGFCLGAKLSQLFHLITAASIFVKIVPKCIPDQSLAVMMMDMYLAPQLKFPLCTAACAWEGVTCYQSGERQLQCWAGLGWAWLGWAGQLLP